MRVELEDFFQQGSLYLSIDIRFDVKVTGVNEAHIYDERHERLMPYETISPVLRDEIKKRIESELKSSEIRL